MGGGFAYAQFITLKGSIQALFCVVVVGMVLGFIIKVSDSRPMPPEQREKVTQVSSLHRKDLIVFDDNRVWLIRSDTAGGSLRFVEWAGNTTQIMSITSFVIGSGTFRVVRRQDPDWEKYIERFLDQ